MIDKLKRALQYAESSKYNAVNIKGMSVSDLKTIIGALEKIEELKKYVDGFDCVNCGLIGVSTVDCVECALDGVRNILDEDD